MTWSSSLGWFIGSVPTSAGGPTPTADQARRESFAFAVIATVFMVGCAQKPVVEPVLPEASTVPIRLTVQHGTASESFTAVEWVVDTRPAMSKIDIGRYRGRAELLCNTATARLPSQAGILSMWLASDDKKVPSGMAEPDAMQPVMIRSFDPTNPPHELVLSASTVQTRVRVRVTDFRGVPQPNAWLNLVLSEEGGYDPDWGPFAANSDGTIVTSPLGYMAYWIDVAAPGMAPIRYCPFQFDARESGKFNNVVLPRAERVAVTVLAPSGDANDCWLDVSYDSSPNGSPTRYFVTAKSGIPVLIDLPTDRAAQLLAGSAERVSDAIIRAPDGGPILKIELHRP